jgi:hypothetical protein
MRTRAPRRGSSRRSFSSVSSHALTRLNGTWRISGRSLGSNVDNVRGTTRIRWISPGALQEQRGVIRVGKLTVRAIEIVACHRRSTTFPSWVFSERMNRPLSYRWEVRGNVVRHSGLGWTFRGTLSRNGRFLRGGWRPNRGTRAGPGSAYDVVMTRVRAE